TPLAGPWPDGRGATRHELARYLGDVADGSLDRLPTGCEPWTGRDVTVHLAATFRRFGRMLEQGRGGDFTPPFAPDELDVENLRAVESFTGDPVAALDSAANGFLDQVDDLAEPVPHQIGTLPAGLLVLFGLMDVAIHHDDVVVPAGRRYRPRPETVEAILPMVERLFGLPPDQADPWGVVLVGSGRPPIDPDAGLTPA
ncbi:MAG: maleylpyruvate isomerase family mycothiol-dependent enzyme, partial [Acidimicrobiales bacterium]